MSAISDVTAPKKPALVIATDVTQVSTGDIDLHVLKYWRGADPNSSSDIAMRLHIDICNLEKTVKSDQRVIQLKERIAASGQAPTDEDKIEFRDTVKSMLEGAFCAAIRDHYGISVEDRSSLEKEFARIAADFEGIIQDAVAGGLRDLRPMLGLPPEETSSEESSSESEEESDAEQGNEDQED